MSAAAPSLPKPRFRFKLRREYGLLVLWLAIMVDVSRSLPSDALAENFWRVMRDQAHLGVLALGMTLVILTGGIDLSVGSIVALAGVALGVVWKSTGNPLIALGAAIAVGGACGALNGLLVAKGRVPPLIVTLATLSVFRGAAYAVGGSTTTGKFSPLILAWSRNDFAGLPAPFVMVVALMIGAGIYLARTDGGRAVYAVGANQAAARLSGVPVQAIKFRLYLLSGLLAALAAILYAAKNDSVRADIGAEYELMAITIVVLGGTSVSGGEGSMAGTALGYLTLVFLQNDLALRRLPGEYHGLAVAVLLIGALLLDAGFRKRALQNLETASAVPQTESPVPPAG
jgi:ribose/xylose/arabinose/galactoside ABC-type transport system permease subunit